MNTKRLTRLYCGLQNEKKQAFLMLKKGATVAICDYEEEVG